MAHPEIEKNSILFPSFSNGLPTGHSMSNWTYHQGFAAAQQNYNELNALSIPNLPLVPRMINITSYHEYIKETSDNSFFDHRHWLHHSVYNYQQKFLRLRSI